MKIGCRAAGTDCVAFETNGTSHWRQDREHGKEHRHGSYQVRRLMPAYRHRKRMPEPTAVRNCGFVARRRNVRRFRARCERRLVGGRSTRFRRIPARRAVLRCLVPRGGMHNALAGSPRLSGLIRPIRLIGQIERGDPAGRRALTLIALHSPRPGRDRTSAKNDSARPSSRRCGCRDGCKQVAENH